MINKKVCIIVVVIGLLSIISLSEARELKNNFYFTLQPDSSKCINIRLPSDVNLYDEDRVTINISTEATANLKFIDVLTSPYNPVNVPLCFLSSGMKDGDYSNYSITLSSSKGSSETVSGGFCIFSDDTKIAIGRPETNICDFIIKDEKLFDLSFQYGDRIPLSKDKPGKVPIRLYSQNKLDLELNVKSDVDVEPKTQTVRLEPRKWTTFDFEVPRLKQGNYPLTLTADVVVNGTYCDSKKIPFCRKEISSTLMVDSLGLQGWYLYVTPQSYSAYDTKPVPYSAVIENYGDSQEFSLELKLPDGLVSDFEKSKAIIESQGKKEFLINITPQTISAGNFEIGFIAKGNDEKSVKSYLSFRDTEANIKSYWSDIRDKVSPELRPVIDAKIRDFLKSYRENGINVEEYQALLSLLEQAKGQVFGGDLGKVVSNQTKNRPEIKSTRSIDPLIIVMAIVLIIITLSLIFYVKIKGSNKTKAVNY